MSPHLLVFPYPAQGHMLSLLHLSHHLSLHGGLSITILITPKNLPILTPLLSSNPSIQTLILPFPPHPSIPAGAENVKDIGNHGNIPIIAALSKLQGPVIEWFNSHPNPPVALLSDFFLGWTEDLATKLGIPRIVYYSAGAFLNSLFYCLWSDPEGLYVSKPGSEISFPDLPRNPSFEPGQLPSLYRRYRGLEKSDPDFEVMRALMDGNKVSWGGVFNSFHELEGEFLDHIMLKIGHPKLFTVGPVNMESFNGGKETSGENDRVMSWLDQWDEDGCVLYVCFGSQKWLKKAQMEALASALEKSGVRFIWAFKLPTAQQVSDGYGSVPVGFGDRVSGRGLIIEGWAPQPAILSHRAVGVFLSHCGWNSVLEATVSGVMVLGWPMEADQFVNAKLLVEYKGAAVLACEGNEDTVPDPTELARKINEAMRADAVERVRAKELTEKALEGIKVGGSSYKDLDRFIQEIALLKV